MCLCLLALCRFAHGAAPPTVALPDDGTYSLWVQARAGTVSVLPMTVTHKKSVILPNAHPGDTLFVLDAHTGSVAARAITAGAPLTLAVSDFRPVTVPLAAAAFPASPPPLPKAQPAPAPKPKGDGVGQFLSWLLGLALAAGVVWVLVRLVRTRGEPLLALARKVGIDVPDPKALDPNAGVMPVYQPPKPRAVEAIPEEAGLAVGRPPAPAAGGTSVPQLVGTEGLAAGSTFALSDGATTVGRDGGNDIVLAEDSVSRRHARLTRGAGGGVLLADSGSANGVLVNGRRVQEVALAHGDEIRIGDNAFRFEGPS